MADQQTTTNDDHLTPEELAARWHKSKGTLANWRCGGKGPDYTKIGKTVLYPVAAVQRYEQANMVQ